MRMKPFTPPEQLFARPLFSPLPPTPGNQVEDALHATAVDTLSSRADGLPALLYLPPTSAAE